MKNFLSGPFFPVQAKERQAPCLEPTTTYFCHFDARLLRPALQNLLCNALEAAPEGSDVQVNIVEGQNCRIEIKNKGVVPEAIRKKILKNMLPKGKQKVLG